MDDDILDGMESADTDGTVPIGCRRCCLKKSEGAAKNMMITVREREDDVL